MTAEELWEAYQQLWRYVQWPNHHSRLAALPIPVPKSTERPACLHHQSLLPTSIPPFHRSSPVARTAAIHCADVVSHLRASHPLPVPGDVYAYYYLFCQWLRVSHPANPRWIDAETGWTNLRWLPFVALNGRIGSNTPRLAWERWYREWWIQKGQREDIHVVQYVFPLPAPSLHTQTDSLTDQLDVFEALRADGNDDVRTIFTHYDATGTKRRAGFNVIPWRPEIVAARPESWEPAELWKEAACQHVVPYVIDLCSRRKAWLGKFLESVVPAVNPDIDTPALRWKLYLDLMNGFEGLLERKAPHLVDRFVEEHRTQFTAAAQPRRNLS